MDEGKKAMPGKKRKGEVEGRTDVEHASQSSWLGELAHVFVYCVVVDGGGGVGFVFDEPDSDHYHHHSTFISAAAAIL